ncbi:PEPxxWA-CTERM sorting domain-containing protein [Sandaracinobacteroides saxicola]|nr:PEPxxWA-CTERM sorting domain-containing protein [Sandaracinobacteroides saxicola]
MRHISAILIGMAAVVIAPAATANPSFVYMTGSENPWGLTAADAGSPEAAMVTLYGAGNYTRYQGFDATAFNASTSSFIYMEGSERAGAEMISFLNANPGLLDSYLIAGGRLYLNAALTQQPAATVFVALGLSLSPGASNTGTNPRGAMDQLAINGAGTSWSGLAGQPFSTHVVSGTAPLGTFEEIEGSAGPNWLWTYEGGGGYLFLGAQTAPAFHSNGGVGLRVNLLCKANGSDNGICDDIGTPVPEPATWAMLIVGFGLVGSAVRRRRTMAA